MDRTKSLLETTLNTRDLGGYPTASGAYTKWGHILRSDVMKYASAQDIAFLKKNRILTVIDVRGEKDVKKSPNSLAKEAGFQYWNLPIVEGSTPPETPEAVPDSYMEIAQAANMGQVFSVMARAPQGVLFHCTAGKDRTGVISAILLLLAGVPEKEIIRDYMVTKEANGPRFELLRQKFPELNFNVVIPQEVFMEGFLQRFSQKYGTAQQYLSTLGLKDSEIESLKDKLVVILPVHFTTKRLEIKPLTPEDLLPLEGLFVNEQVKKTFLLPDFGEKQSLDAFALRFIRLSQERFVRGIYRDDALIGFVNQVEQTQDWMELGYVIHPDAWNRGYATEMLEAVMERLLEAGIPAIRTGAFEENPASIRVMEKCGMDKLPGGDTLEYRGTLHRCVYYEYRK